MDFWEELPDQCPPVGANDGEFDNLYRIISAANATDADFKSSRALGKPLPPGVEECRWASCSLVYDPKPLLKLPKFKRHKWVAKLKIPPNSGLGHASNSNHIDYWWAKQCDITKCIVAVVEVGNV